MPAGGTYSVKEIFLTVQGEGARAGSKAVFLRFTGCNVWTGRPQDRSKGKGACAAWCDSDFFKGKNMTTRQIVERLDELWPDDGKHQRWVVLTGGEPALQWDMTLRYALEDADWFVAMETNGTVLLQAPVDWLTVSPKLGTKLVVTRGDELKVVLPGVAPGTTEQGWTAEQGWTDEQLEQLAGVKRFEHKFVQPQDVVRPEATGETLLSRNLTHPMHTAEALFRTSVKRCLDFINTHPDWRLSYQVHKAIGVP
jgi:organic radical activating enzyme